MMYWLQKSDMDDDVLKNSYPQNLGIAVLTLVRLDWIKLIRVFV